MSSKKEPRIEILSVIDSGIFTLEEMEIESMICCHNGDGIGMNEEEQQK